MQEILWKFWALITLGFLFVGVLFLPSGQKEDFMYVGAQQYLDERRSQGIVYEVRLSDKQITNQFDDFEAFRSVESLDYHRDSNQIFVAGPPPTPWSDEDKVHVKNRVGTIASLNLKTWEIKTITLPTIEAGIPTTVMVYPGNKLYVRNPRQNREHKEDVSKVFSIQQFELVNETKWPLSHKGRIGKSGKLFAGFSPSLKLITNLQTGEVKKYPTEEEIIESGGLHFPEEKINEPFCYADPAQNGTEVAIYDRDTLKKESSIKISDYVDEELIRVQPQISRLRVTPDEQYCVVPLIHRRSHNKPPTGRLAFFNLQRQKLTTIMETAPGLTHPVFRQKPLRVWELILRWVR